MEIPKGWLRQRRAAAIALLVSTLMAACGSGENGGGNGGAATPVPASAATSTPVFSASAVDTTGLASEGLNWFNVRRQQIGLAPVTRQTLLDNAALGHSNYQKVNNTITHDQVRGMPAFTGENVGDRLAAAGYAFTESSYSYGEVISATTDGSGMQAAENLIGAIYHRYVIFEPMFREAGAGAAEVTGGFTYFTVNFAANGLNSGVGRGNLVTYPAANQQSVERAVFSDRESPDPFPAQDEVGYPISVHADIVSDISVQSFTVRPRGGNNLPVRLLTGASDVETPPSAAAIIPIAALAPGTTYDVQFTGTVDRLPVTKAWSFTTR